MAAFDRIKSGIPEMDQALDNIRLGDNVVWRVPELSHFKLFMEPYIRQAVADRRNIIYFRFAGHEPLVKQCPEVKRIYVPLTHRFENFTVAIHNVIEEEGYDAFYVFDCLSELQTAWATDLMMTITSLSSSNPEHRLKYGYSPDHQETLLLGASFDVRQDEKMSRIIMI